MSTITTDLKPARKQKQRESKLHPAQGVGRLKTVVRRLPPNLPEEVFWQSVQAWVTDDTVTWKVYCPGKLRTKRINKEGISSRAYIAFKNEEQVVTFSREYNGHVFRDKAGNESQAVVEYAPFQKVATEKKKVDARNNTIDRDEDYLSFLESLKNATKTEPVPLEALIAASQPPPPPTTTPLLEALKAEKSAQKDKEAILRNHAHYKDAAASGASSKKEEAKKKAAAAAVAAKQQQQQQQQQQLEPSAPLSKKAKKAASTPAQDGQGPSAKNVPAGTTAPLIAKPPAARQRPPKEGRKNDGATAPAPSSSASGPAPVPAKSSSVPPQPVTTEHPAAGSPVQGQRKGRPVVGLGRQFEAALSGAGVAVAPSPSAERKKRDKGSEPRSSAQAGEAGGAGKHREDRISSPASAVPSILQRPADAGAPAEVIIMQRSQSPRGTEGPGQAQGQGHVRAHAQAEGSVPPTTGPPRGRRGRGRGRGHRGG